MSTPLTEIVKLFEKLLSDADEKLVDIILSDRSKEVYLTAPSIILTLYKKALLLNDLYSQEKSQAPFLLNRINIFPSAGWKITLYHKDYSLTREAWMKTEMPMSAPQKNQDNKTTLFFR